MVTCKICLKEFKFNYLLLRHNNSKKKCKPINNNDDDFYNIDEQSDIEENTIDNKIFNNIKYNNINKLEEEIQIIDDNIINKTKISMEQLKCMFCNKDFSKKYNITRHLNNYCTSLKKLNEDKNKMIEEINKLNEEINNVKTQMELKELRKVVSKILKRKPQNVNITNNKITNNKITNNNLMVNINSFGNESLSHITINDYKRLEKIFIKPFLSVKNKLKNLFFSVTFWTISGFYKIYRESTF